jgi:ABC-type uncharacterized transport system substrate-binding protein
MQIGPDVLVGLGNPVITALKNATATIPIVFMTGEPIAAGYVASMARPGGNMTGVSMMQGMSSATRSAMRSVRHSAKRYSTMMFCPST